jgi:hypothetical protein
MDEILRLHGVLIEDMRLVKPGLRPDGVFLGERDPEGNPLPEFIGALIDMPDQTIDLLFRMLRQNNGRLSRRAREREFA